MVRNYVKDYNLTMLETADVAAPESVYQKDMPRRVTIIYE